MIIKTGTVSKTEYYPAQIIPILIYFVNQKLITATYLTPKSKLTK